jgi:Peptidase family M3
LYQTPEFVLSFLHHLLSQLHPLSVREVELIREEKRKDAAKTSHSTRHHIHDLHSSSSSSISHPSASRSSSGSRQVSAAPSVVHEWDAPFYIGRMKATLFDLDSAVLSRYFSLDNCIRGIDIVFRSLFDCQLRPATFAQGEDWTEVWLLMCHLCILRSALSAALIVCRSFLPLPLFFCLPGLGWPPSAGNHKVGDLASADRRSSDARNMTTRAAAEAAAEGTIDLTICLSVTLP